VSDALDKVRDERANGRVLPSVSDALDELDARVRALETPADKAPAETPKGGK
jgi:hypothetical protein